MTIQIQRIYTLAVVGVLTIFPGFSVFADGNQATDEELFSSGQYHYENGKYENARNAFSRAVAVEPENSRYHHWLGKTYGRLAEKAGILQAYKLSNQVRQHLERAVELDNTNVPALADLMQYYRQAPAFLGGGNDKAADICRQLREIQESGSTGVSSETSTDSQENCR